MEYKMSQLKEMSVEDLQKLLAEKQAELRSLRFQVWQNELKQVDKVGKLKKLIARIQTALRQTV